VSTEQRGHLLFLSDYGNVIIHGLEEKKDDSLRLQGQCTYEDKVDGAQLCYQS
jgi:hypothetical protein